MDNGLSPSTDWELLQRARQGDVQSFHELVDRHAGSLYGLAVSLLGQAADAEDVLQETLVGAFRGLHGFRQEASVKTWLMRILVRQAARHRRSRERWPDGNLAGADGSGSPGASAQERSDIRMDFTRALAAVSPEHREVIVLRELQGLSYDQIAEVLDVPPGTVESRLHRARRQLQTHLKEYFG
jgi:RNA polymerase sigma-70 factor, ECF subfamily